MHAHTITDDNTRTQTRTRPHFKQTGTRTYRGRYVTSTSRFPTFLIKYWNIRLPSNNFIRLELIFMMLNNKRYHPVPSYSTSGAAKKRDINE